MIKSSLEPKRVASLIAARILPHGGDMEWKDLDGEGLMCLGLDQIMGGAVELQENGGESYVLTYKTDNKFLDEQALKPGVIINSRDFVDVTPLLLYALGKIPGLEIEGVDLSR